MFGFVKRLFASHSAGKEPSLRERRADAMQALYDAAQTTELNARYWKNADALSADESNSLEVRKQIRQRARYEVQNNSWARGMTNTLANYVIGTGPRLSMATGNAKADRFIESEFAMWAKKVKLAKKLRTMRVAKVVDGEAFAMFSSNPKLRTRVQLDLKLVECDQITTPFFFNDQTNAVDGIIFDEFDNPETYHKLKAHPGGNRPLDSAAIDEIAADVMIHLFREDRPGQHRGMSEIAPALPLFALLRDFTIAVLTNARSAAKFTGVLESQSGAELDGANVDPATEAFDMVDIDYDMLTTLPFGYRLAQLKAEQPATTFEMFVKMILNEIARCLSMPFAIAAGNSAGLNYSSGRLDHQAFFEMIDVERNDIEIDCLDRIFAAWLDEALLIEGYLPELPAMVEVPHAWYWDGREHVDPQKEATAQGTRLASATTTRTREYALQGLDIDEQDEIGARENGVSIEEYRAAVFKKTFAAGGAPETSTEETDGDQEEETATAAAAA